MDKSKVPLVTMITFVATTGAMVFVCANAHIDFFPCKKTVRDFAHADPFTGEAKLKTEDGTCALLDHLRDGIDGEKDELTGAGWALLAAFCIGIGVADAALMYTLLSRKSTTPA